MEFRIRNPTQLKTEAENVLGLTEVQEIRDYIEREQERDRQQAQDFRDQRAAEREAQRAEREHELAMEQLRVEEAARVRQHELALQNASGVAAGPVNVTQRAATVVPTLQLSKFVVGDKLEPFLARFEEVAECLEWPDKIKAIQFADLFTGQPLEIIMRIDQPHRTYEEMKNALLQAYGLTAETARYQFYGAKIRENETAAQFVVRLTNFLGLWMEKDGTENTVEGIKDLLIRSQFERSCSQDLVAQFKLNNVKSVQEMKAKAEAHFAAYGSEAYKLKRARGDAKTSAKQSTGYGSSESGSGGPVSHTNYSKNYSGAGQGGRGYHHSYGNQSGGGSRAYNQHFGHRNDSRKVRGYDERNFSQGRRPVYTQGRAAEVSHPSGSAGAPRAAAYQSCGDAGVDYQATGARGYGSRDKQIDVAHNSHQM